MNCNVCGQPMRQIPAGVSKKTGMAYDAFMACPNRCRQVKTSPNAPQSPTTHQNTGSGDVAFKIMSDEFIALKNKIEELIKEIQQNVIGN